MMTDKALLLLAALAPTAMSLIGIIFAKSDLKDFKAEVRSKFDEIDGKFGEVRRQQESLAKKLDDVMASGHKDALEIMRQMTTLHERVAVVEAKQAR
jgi:chaperonin cofactor prefoldin